MNVILQLDNREVARFEYGAHAMWAAIALSKEDIFWAMTIVKREKDDA